MNTETRFSNTKKHIGTALMPFLAVLTLYAASPVWAAESVIATVLTGEAPPVIYEGVQGPAVIVVNPVTNKIYAGHGIHNGDVNVIDGVTHAITTVTVGSGASAMAVNPVTNKIYAANWFDPTVAVIDGATNATTTIADTAINRAQNAIVVDSGINKIYVLSVGGVTVIDGVTDTVVTKIPVSGTRLAVNPATHKIYVADFYNPTSVTVIDGTTYAVTTNLTIGLGAAGTYGNIAVNPVTNRVYVTSDYNNTVTVVDGDTDAVIFTIAVDVGYGNETIAVNPNTNKVYVVSWSRIAVIDGVTNSIEASLATVSHQQADIEVNTVNNKIYVGKFGYSGSPHYVISIDGNTNSFKSIVTGYGGLDIVDNPQTSRVYATNSYNNTVSVIGDPDTDTTPPYIGVSQTPLPNASGWNNSDVTVNFIALDGVSTPTCTVNSVTLTAEGAGQVVSTTCTNGFGNSATASHTVNIDKTPPVVTASPAGGIYKAPQSVTLSANEPATIYYTVNGSTPTIGSTVYTVPIAIPVNATTTLKYIAKDAADNISEPVSQVYTVDIVAPTTPTGLKATVVSKSQINLTWTASSDNFGVVGYKIERCTGSKCTNFVQVGTSATTSFNNTGLATRTSYRYRVRAYDAAGNDSAYSTPIVAKTL